jgi:hypothetical protein
MPRDPKRNTKSRVYERRRYGTSSVKKAAIKKVKDSSMRARQLDSKDGKMSPYRKR